MEKLKLHISETARCDLLKNLDAILMKMSQLYDFNIPLRELERMNNVERDKHTALLAAIWQTTLQII